MAPRRHLPPELVDMVISHAYDDRPTLASCALVARSWLSRSRDHLFAEVTIYVEEQYEEFLQLLDANSMIAAKILSLIVVSRTESTINSESFREMLSCLPNLDTLELSGVQFMREEGVTTARRHRTCLPMSLLFLRNLTASADVFVQLLNLFAYTPIESLWLEGCTITACDDDHPSNTALALPVPLKIGELSLQASSSETLFSIFARVLDPAEFHHLDIDRGAVEHAVEGSFLPFLRSLGPSIFTLEWDVTSLCDFPAEAHGAVLGYCASLQNLTLSFAAGCPIVGWIGARNCLSGFPTCLCPFLPQSTRIITLCFARQCSSRLLQSWIDSVDLPDLERALLRLESFGLLRILYTKAPDSSSSELPPPSQARIRNALPVLAGMGKLSFLENADDE